MPDALDNSDRGRAKRQPSDEIHFVDPPGRIAYAEVYDPDGLAGWVWITARREVVPRAGILLTPTSVRDPSVMFQDDLGEVTLRMRNNSRTEARSFMGYLATTRDGVGGVLISDVRSAGSFSVLRRLAGQFQI